MKFFKLFLLVLIFPMSFLSAQVSEEQRTMNLGINNALIINIPDADDKMVEKLWKKYLKTKDAKTKKVKKSEEWLSENADIPAIGGNSEIDVYASFEQSGDDVILSVWFDLTGGFLSSTEHPERYDSGKSFLMDFENEVYKEGVKLEIKEEENNLKVMESKLKKLKKDKDRYEREIEQAKERIAKAEANIESNLVDQEETMDKIASQKSLVEKTRKKLDIREGNQ